MVLSCFQAEVWGQTINGKVIDSKQQPIDGATIVLQAMDSTYIGASISNTDGTFTLKNKPKDYRLIIQHLLYQTKIITGKGNNAGIIQLHPQDYALDEVVVKAERPFVKVENGRLGYNLAVLTRNQLVNNAYEALAKLPGVQEDRGSLTLAGAGKLTVILNGKPAPDTMVEVEYYNVDHRVKAPDDIFITQQVKTDKNGIFSYAVPWEGWWGFAALNDADYKIKKDGQDKDVELGAVLWTEFVNPSFK